MIRILTFYLFLSISFAHGQPFKMISPEDAGMDPDRLGRVDTVIGGAIEAGNIPGAVLLVMRDDRIVHRKAYGFRQIVPEKESMKVHTVFDLASLTKPVATATAVMMLVDRGDIRLLDRVSDILPVFKGYKAEEGNSLPSVRLIHLLTHTSGLPAYANVEELTKQYGHPQPDSLLAHIATVKRDHEPGTFFRYSCLNFITLQRVVEAVSGVSLKEFTEKNIFKPLGMDNTEYLPRKRIVTACAATEKLDSVTVLKGVVHDPLARIMMGGISGNAGLFSTADDLAIFSSMMLNEGIYNDKRILSKAAVRKMTSLPEGYEFYGRGLGWDLNSAYASNQGDLFGGRAYGHTGYTGTSLIIDPDTGTVVIFLTNRVHPDDEGNVVRLRSLVANVVAGSLVDY